MSGGTVDHDLIVDNIRAALRSRLRSRSSSCNTFGENVQVLVGIKKSGKRHYLYPDTTVSCAPEDRRSGNTLVESPKLVIEVLSPGTERKDRGVKFRAYQGCPTIQEIALINQFIPYVEIWQRDAENVDVWHFRLYREGETVEFASVEMRIPIEELYLDINWPVDEGDEE